MPVQGEGPSGVSRRTFSTSVCAFCGHRANKDDPELYREVVSWVHGPKLDGPVLRQQTGNVAHKVCMEKVIRGQAPDQPEMDI